MGCEVVHESNCKCNALAQYDLGIAHSSWYAVDQTKEKAVDWYRRHVNYGTGTSVVNMATPIKRNRTLDGFPTS